MKKVFLICALMAILLSPLAQAETSTETNTEKDSTVSSGQGGIAASGEFIAIDAAYAWQFALILALIFLIGVTTGATIFPLIKNI